MTTHANAKALIKILIGAAWLDGQVQPEEQQYLKQMAQAHGVAEDPEIRPLLYQLVGVSRQKCYNWIRDYLGDHPNQDNFQDLLEAVSALIYSDGSVEMEEAELLSRLQLMDPSGSSPDSSYQAVINRIKKMYQKWIEQQG